MTTTDKLLSRYGNPSTGRSIFEQKHMTLYRVPAYLRKEIPCLPEKIYLNKDALIPLENTLNDLIDEGFHKELKTYDGCFNVRLIRGSKTTPSVHSWGLAFDFNAKDNPLGGPVRFSKEFLDIWTDNGWTCGAFFTRKDGMHFELTSHL